MEPKPCPFCGHPAYKLRKNELPEELQSWHLYTCSYSVCPVSNYQFTEEDWNARPIEDDLRQQLEKAEALLERSIDYNRYQKKRNNEKTADS